MDYLAFCNHFPNAACALPARARLRRRGAADGGVAGAGYTLAASRLGPQYLRGISNASQSGNLYSVLASL